jgi:hypothetical protein
MEPKFNRKKEREKEKRNIASGNERNGETE